MSNSVTSQIFYKNGTVANTLSAVNPSSTTNLNMGIGTNTPKSKLDIEGNVAIGTSYSGGTTAAPANGAIIEGNVGIGTNAPTTKLEVKSDAAGVSGLKLTNLNNLSPTTTGNGTALSVDATGNMVLVPVVNTVAAANTLYSADDSLASNRTVGMGGKNLTFATSTISETPLLSINGTNGNVGIGLQPTDFGKLQIAGLANNAQTFTNIHEAYKKCNLLNIGSLRETAPNNSSPYRLLTFADFPISNIFPNAQTMLAIEDRNDANRLRYHVITGGTSTFTLSDKTQSKFFDVYEDGTNAIMTLPKPNSYLSIGGVPTWPINHSFWVRRGTSRFDNDVFAQTHLGIGTDKFIDPIDNKEYKLSVKGRIRAEEVKVYNTWADYVFNKDYKLTPLAEVEKFIKENKHLPNVPSAKEVTEKGLELGEMAKIQQEKIEELTLYLIQQNKEIQELKTQVKVLMNKK
ncbi:hypothetical protein ACLH3T_001557 [Flavobacterium psychrophilum]